MKPAAHAGRMGKKVALIERGALGGTCLNVVCIPTKTFSAPLMCSANAARRGVSASRPRAYGFDLPAVCRAQEHASSVR